MKFAKSAPITLMAAVAVVVAGLSFASNLISHQMAASFEETQFELIGQIVQSRLAGAENKAIASAEIVAAMPAVKTAFAARDRAGLLAITQDAFKVQHEKYGISQAQFHTAPAVSFLRVHNPAKFGEDLAGYRQIVVEVNQTAALRKGIEITTSGIGIFGTLPMTDVAGKPTGSFEMGLELGPLLDDLKKEHGFELAFYADEKELRDTATALKGEIFNDQNRVGKYVKFYATHADLIKPLVGGDDIGVTEGSHYVRDSAGVPYGVLLMPVTNYAKKQIGVLAVAKDFSATRSADRKAVVWQTLLGIIAIVLLSGVVLVVVRGLLLEPLKSVSARLAALARGESPDEDTGTVPACDEIAELAANVDALRARQAEGLAPAAGGASS